MFDVLVVSMVDMVPVLSELTVCRDKNQICKISMLYRVGWEDK